EERTERTEALQASRNRPPDLILDEPMPALGLLAAHLPKPRRTRSQLYRESSLPRRAVGTPITHLVNEIGNQTRRRKKSWPVPSAEKLPAPKMFSTALPSFSFGDKTEKESGPGRRN